MWGIKENLESKRQTRFVKLLWMRQWEEAKFCIISWEEKSTYEGIEWYFVWAKRSEYERQWQKIDTFIITLKDEEWLMERSASMNNVTRSIINSILWLSLEDLWKKLTFKVRENKIDKNIYKNWYLYCEWDKTQRKYSKEEEKSMITYDDFKGQKIANKTKFDETLFEWLLKISELFEKSKEETSEKDILGFLEEEKDDFLF